MVLYVQTPPGIDQNLIAYQYFPTEKACMARFDTWSKAVNAWRIRSKLSQGASAAGCVKGKKS